jgi:signal peptidase I
MVEATTINQSPWWRTILIGRNPALTFSRLIVVVILLVGLRTFVFWPIRVKGMSMLPTYRDNQINVVNHLAYRWNEPQRGDVVAIRHSGYSVMLMKRIVALPGETVAFKDGHLLVNGTEQSEPYVRLPCRWQMAPVQLGANEYFVVGDNRSMLIDDHEFGRATRDRIMGKVLL